MLTCHANNTLQYNNSGLVRSLLLNAPFRFMTLSGVGYAILIAGFGAFGLKYLENQFSLSSATAGMICGKYHLQMADRLLQFQQN